MATGLERSVFIPIPKKGNAKECSNYRTIALISHASKVCSYGDELTFTFSSLLKDTSVQKVFFRSLAEDGIDVEIETNGVYYD